MNRLEKLGKQTINSEKKIRFNKKNILIFIGAFASLFLILSIYPAAQWIRGNIIDGVKVGQYSLSNMTYSQVKQITNKDVNSILNRGVLTLKDNETQKIITIKAKDIDAIFDSHELFEAAYKIGRIGQGSNNNIFSAMIETYKATFFGIDVESSLRYNTEKLSSIIEDYADDFKQISVIPSYAIEGDKLLITPGKKGRELNKHKTTDLIIKKMSTLNFAMTDCIFDVVEPTPINIDEIYKNVVKNPSDAKIVFDSSGKQTLQIEVVGVNFDLAAAKKTIKNLYSSYTIPLTMTKPKVTYKDLDINPDSGIFKDIIASFSTTLDTSLKNRTHNVKLASDKINNTILNPGDEFSFNKVVGPREISTGFLEAKVYMANEIVDGVGGGICQVSSTIYVVSLLSDMKILERQNHRFTVSYVNPGYDATVAYGVTDFRFKNPYDTPIKITSQLEGNKLTIQIRGTKTNNKAYTLSYNVTDRVDYSVRKKTDHSLAEGTTKVSQGGQQGYTAQLFRSYKNPDASIVKELINTSKYSPADRIILINEPEAKPTDTQSTDTQTTQAPSIQVPDNIVPGLDNPYNNKKDNKLPPELGGPLN